MRPEPIRLEDSVSTYRLGIWDVLSNQEVVSFVRRRIAQKMEPEEVNVSMFKLPGAKKTSVMKPL